jgi:antitoxin VapB
MPLYVKDPEVDHLVGRLAEKQSLSKTEVVRLALQRELDRLEDTPSLVEKGMAFVRALHARSNPARGQVVDKAFIDGLYED